MNREHNEKRKLLGKQITNSKDAQVLKFEDRYDAIKNVHERLKVLKCYLSKL